MGHAKVKHIKNFNHATKEYLDTDGLRHFISKVYGNNYKVFIGDYLYTKVDDLYIYHVEYVAVKL